jgi:superfamily II RNA helicase
MACNIKKTSPTRKNRLKLKKVDVNQVKGILDFRMDIPEDCSSKTLENLVDSITMQDLKILSLDIFQQSIEPEELNAAKRGLSSLPCEGCEHLKTCHRAKKGPLKKLLRDFPSLAIHMEGMGRGLWPSFKRHLRFLKETGFLNEKDRLTPDGHWASKLRLDQPLLIAEAIRKGAFGRVSPEILAGCLAPFVWDKVQEHALKTNGVPVLTEIEDKFNKILDHIEPIRALKNKRGLESPPIQFWPAAAIFLWAEGTPWEQLLDFASIDEGDMASLIMRTADHLRQVTNLRETHSELASVAEKAIELIVREPVYIP